MKSHGFTLIELLVVIAIIAMLSSIVLAQVKVARDKANQTSNSNTVDQNIIALQEYYDDNGQFPQNGTTGWRCLGDFSDNKCGFNNSQNEDPVTLSQFGTYIKNLQTFTLPWDVAPGTTYEGPEYGCNAIVGGKCVWGTIRYLVKGDSRKLCANACNVSNYFGGYWMCQYNFGRFNEASCARAD